jgi:hypothetical protein
MQPPAITLWRSKRGRFLRASWRDGGKKVTWDTRALEDKEARARATAEWTRRKLMGGDGTRRTAPTPDISPAPAPAVQFQPAPSAMPTSADVRGAFPPSSSSSRRPIGDAITRAFGAAGGAAEFAAAPPPPPAAGDEESRAKAKKLYEYFAKLMAMVTEGSLKRACRFAGREPEDMDDDEIRLVREGWEEKGADWFGRTNIGPWGKIALGSAVAGVGMYMGGTPIEKPKPKELPPAAAGSNVRLEREGGSGDEV